MGVPMQPEEGFDMFARDALGMSSMPQFPPLKAIRTPFTLMTKNGADFGRLRRAVSGVLRARVE